MQYLIREATRAKNIILHALETAYQPHPDATLMWCAGWIEPPLCTFVSEFSCNVDNVPLFNTFSEFFVRSNKVSAIVRPNHGRCTLRDTNRSTPITQELVSVDVTTSTWTARVVRQVKRTPHLFSVVRRTVTKNCPKESTPVFVKGGDW